LSGEVHKSLRIAQAKLIHSTDIAVRFWNRLPQERAPTHPDQIVLAIFAGAGGATIITALALMAAVPR
jgi:hypothetical protein